MIIPDPETPFNELPFLPPNIDLEILFVLKASSAIENIVTTIDELFECAPRKFICNEFCN